MLLGMGFVELLMSGLKWIYEGVYYAMDRMFQWLQAFFFWVWEWIWIYAVELWEAVGMPDLSLPEVPAGLYSTFAMANAWVPLREGLLLTITYFTFVLILTPARVILRHLPVIGG